MPVPLYEENLDMSLESTHLEVSGFKETNHVRPTVIGLLRSNPKTVTAFIAAVTTAAGYFGIDYSLLAQRSGAEFWKNEGGAFKAVEAYDLSQGDTVLRIDWSGSGREIKELQLFKVNNEPTAFDAKTESQISKEPPPIQSKIEVKSDPSLSPFGQ